MKWIPSLAAIVLGAAALAAGEAAPPAASAIPPLAAWATRDAPDQVAALAREFLALTFVGEWDEREFRRPGRWEQLKAVRTQLTAGDLPGALEGFKRAFLGKLRAADEYGLATARLDVYSGGPLSWGWVKPLISDGNRAELLARADQLQRGELTVGGKPLAIGEPGAVAWAAATADALARKDWGHWSWHLDTFAPLLAAYVITGEERHLARWAAYADDWALNQRAGPGATNPADIPDQWAGGTEAVVTLLRWFAAIARLPGGAERLPAATFARTLARLVVDQVPATVLYHRANPQNWSDTCAPTLVDLGFILDEFHCGPWLVRDGLRLLELAVPTRHQPDGVDSDSTVGYGFTYLHGAVPLLERLKMRAYRLADWQVPAWEKDLRARLDLVVWEQRLREELRARARFQTAHLTAAGEWPVGGARTDHRDRSAQTRELVLAAAPELLGQPAVAAIIERAAGRGGQPPPFTSERFPYSGHAYLRAGWERDDPYCYFYCSPRPTLGCMSWRNNNAIGFAGFGQDLLETGENGTYDQPHSPLRVDGQEQFFHLGIPTWGHRGPLLTAWDEPAPWRWHSSAAFDVAEGVYAGAFGKARPVTGVSHQRLVHALRAGGLWIVTDRLRAKEAHDYALDWRFGIQPGKEATDFLPAQIAVDAAQARIATARPKGSNVTLLHFPSTPLAFTTSEQRTPEKNGYRLHDFLTVSGGWKAPGASAVVTAILPRREGRADELREVESLAAPGAVGFRALTPSGLRVSYQAAVEGVAQLAIADLAAEGESLLLTVAADGGRRGVALGCRALSVGGKAVALPGADAEFAITGGAVTTIAIHTPLAPVAITPAAPALFVGEQAITLACATPGAEIRYTLDGTDPDLASPLYRAPFSIAASTVVKARALRPGLAALPATLSGTHATVVARADFTRGDWRAAVAPPTTVPGLRYETVAGRWQDLVMRRERLPLLGSGVADRLFAAPSRVDAPAWGVRYRGWLEVPQDGVYTIHAPPESYLPNIMAGYELTVSLAGQEWYPATTRHALGTWSLALRKGAHAFSVSYADLRGDAPQRLNPPGGQPLVWAGAVPELLLSGPGFAPAPIPAAMLRCAAAP